MKLPAMPVRSGRDATMNFEKLAPVIPTFVSSLPRQPVDGQEVYFQNEGMAAEGVVWHLRYRASSISAFKWEFVGGGDVQTEEGGHVQENGAAGEITTINAGSSHLIIPLAGDYDIYMAVWYLLESATQNIEIVPVNILVPHVALGGVRTQQTTQGANTAYGNISVMARTFNCAAALQVGIGVAFSGPNTKWTSEFNYIRVRPVRVG